MGTLMNLSVILSGINIILILSLIYIYIKNLIKVKSVFTLGLFIFGILFLFHNALYLYFYITMMPYYAQGTEIYIFIFNLIQTFAFAILSFVSWK